ncbi:MAG: ATP-binding cassette domain-containing protein [Streptosporangiaceae bacterium]
MPACPGNHHNMRYESPNPVNGKATTLRMLLGLAVPTSGRALVFGHPYAELPHAALRVGAVLEATDFHPGRSGRDHLRMLGKAVDVPDSRADEVLRLVELGDAARRRVKGYSLGMRQRLGLAAALLGDPQLLTKALRDEALQVTTGTDHALLVQGASSERVGEIAFAAGVPVHELVLDGGGLEDIFLELTSEAPA